MPYIPHHAEELVWVEDGLLERQTLFINFLENKQVVHKGLHKNELSSYQITISDCSLYARVGCSDLLQDASDLRDKEDKTFEWCLHLVTDCGCVTFGLLGTQERLLFTHTP